MSADKIKKEKSLISFYGSPYVDEKRNDVPFEKIYEKYKADPDKIKMIDGRKYYRILQSHIYRLPANKPHLAVFIESELGVKVGDLLADEYGNRFVYKCYSEYCFRGSTPEWYFETVEMHLSGGLEIGEYLCRCDIDKTVIGRIREVVNDASCPSIYDLMSDAPDKNKESILNYLKSGIVTAIAAGYANDVITGKGIDMPLEMMTDGVFAWRSDVIYYYQKYNMRLSDDFIEYVLEKLKN